MKLRSRPRLASRPTKRRKTQHPPKGSSSKDDVFLIASEEKQLSVLKPTGIDGDICSRCRSINVVDKVRWRGNLWETDTHDTGRGGGRITDNWEEYQYELGTQRSLHYSQTCPVCCILKCLTDDGSFQPHDYIVLLPVFTLEHIEPTILPLEGELSDSLKYSRLLVATSVDVEDATLSEDDTGPHFEIPRPHSHNAVCIAGEVDSDGKAIRMSGRKMDGTIDPGRLSHWLQQCAEFHGALCSPMYDPRLVGIRLIDVDKKRLVRYPRSATREYFCLSYVWGNVKQPGCSLGKLPQELPATIADSIELVKSLGRKYLWVDSICIDQNDDAHKDSQIELMRAIYQGACATIVALHGDSANAGLPGLNNGHTRVSQSVFNVDGTTFVSVLPTLRKQIANSTWVKRGWTLQEGELSGRCLYFTADQVYFECHAIQCCETLEDADWSVHRWDTATNRLTYWDKPQIQKAPGVWSGPNWDDLSGEWVKSSKSCVYVYHRLLANYSARKLSYDADILKAISGILDRLAQKSFQGGFFCGMPIDVLPHVLAWYHLGESRRRQGFPTWSWTGWNGEFARVLASFDKKHSPVSAGERPFVGFGKVERGRMKEIYSGNPEYLRPLNAILDATTSEISNDVYRRFDRYRKANLPVPLESVLFAWGFVVRLTLSRSSFSRDRGSPDEEHVYLVDIAGHKCKLTCYREDCVDYIRNRFGRPLHLFVLHTESTRFFNWDSLLLEWTDTMAYRIGAMKFSFPASGWDKVLREAGLTYARLALA